MRVIALAEWTSMLTIEVPKPDPALSNEPIDRAISLAFGFWEYIHSDPHKHERIGREHDFPECLDNITKVLPSLLAKEMTADGRIITIVRGTQIIAARRDRSRHRAFNDALAYLSAAPGSLVSELHESGVFEGEHLAFAREAIFDLAKLAIGGETAAI